MNSQETKQPLVLYALVATIAFGLSVLTTILFNNWSVVNALIYESSLAKYEVMTGERGPVTYLVFHEDFAALESAAEANEGILGVEQHLGSNVAKMAFSSAQSPLIEDIRKLPIVNSMISRNVAMLCH